MKKVIVFDMDDTLYDEYEYVKSGFRAVSEYLKVCFGLEKEETYNWMLKQLEEQGRGKIFDDLLITYRLYKKELVKKCISIYRLHNPTIDLPAISVGVLNELKKHSLYLVTDGNKIVQANKIHALGLDTYMKKCYITYRYGIHNSKPSPYCFELIAKLEKVEPGNIVYIGDNPIKDFVGIKSLGYRTIRIMTGQHKDIEMPENYEAELRINQLSDLPIALHRIWYDFEI